MIISDIITEAPKIWSYGQKDKPEWFDRAVKLKTDNPNITATEIGRQVDASTQSIQYWLTGVDRGSAPMVKRPPESFPFKPGVFTLGGYGSEGKPDWYDQAVQMKLNNPKATYGDIAQALGKKKNNHTALAYWLTGQNRGGNFIDRPHTRDWPPFKPEVFPASPNAGAKPEWYDQALQMAKAGETFTAIGKKFGMNPRSIGHWLVRGQKNSKSGKLINPDAELQPRGNFKLDPQVTADMQNLLKDPKLSDSDIGELIADAHGEAIANMVKKQLPLLRKKQNPGTQVIDKTRTGSMRDPNITGVFNR